MKTTALLSGCLLFAALTFLLGGCSPSRLATRAMAPIIENSRDFALSYPDVETFLQATPSNLFLIEGMIGSDPDNREFRLTASMLYFSYGFAKVEENDAAYASYLYLKGLEHAGHILKKKRAVREGWDGQLDEFASAVRALEEREVPAIVWAAANWSQFINLHLDSTGVLPDIPRVTALLEQACALDEAYFMGLPRIILGILHAFRPPMLGGDPAASLKNFEAAREISKEQFFLCHYFFAKHYCYRMQDPEKFEENLRFVLDNPASAAPEYRLLNEIAKRKAGQLLKEKDELF